MKLPKIQILIASLLLSVIIPLAQAKINATPEDMLFLRNYLPHTNNPTQTLQKALKICNREGFKTVQDCIIAAKSESGPCGSCCTDTFCNKGKQGKWIFCIPCFPLNKCPSHCH